MERRYLSIWLVVILLGVLCLGRGASAQTSKSTGGAACASATLCIAEAGPAAAPAGMQLSMMAVSAVERQPAAGFGLAWAVMILLGAALLYALVSALLVAFGRPAPALPPSSASVLIPILSVLGLGVAIYLTFVETTNTRAVCGPVGDCNAVQASPFARLFGFLPVGLLGAAGYIAILATWGLGRASRGRLAYLAPLAIFGMALFGVLFSIYLTYLELFVIRAVCLWCLTSAVIMALVLGLSAGGAMDAFSGA